MTNAKCVYLGMVFGVWLSLVLPANGLVSREDIDGRCHWVLVFKAVSGNARSVYLDFIGGGRMNVDVPGAMDLSSDLVYRDSRILDKWEQQVIKQVKMEAFSDGERMTWFLFDGLGSRLDSWISQDRLIASPYRSVKTSTKNFFSVLGDPSLSRHFYINRGYGVDCSGDCGYFLVSDPAPGYTCSYDTPPAHPLFIYSTVTDTCAYFATEGDIGYADRLVISVKLCNVDLWLE